MFSLLESFFNDPLWFLEFSLYRIPAVLIALILHEWAHGYVAYRLGDPTAKMMGRLSLNPLHHLDPVGTLMMFLLGFGWAKPVPINPAYFRRPHRDDLLVSVAGVTMNLLLFLLFTALSCMANRLLWEPAVLSRYSLSEFLNLNDGFVNAIVYGYGKEYAAYFARPGWMVALRFFAMTAQVNLYIALFNLLPVPPLDGSHVLNDLILKKNLFVSRRVAGIGMAATLLLSFTGVLGKILSFAAGGVQGAALSLFALLGA